MKKVYYMNGFNITKNGDSIIFGLIDNGSEDNYNINEFSNVEVFKEPNLGQIESYRKYFHSISDKVDWLGVVDVDEFIYSKSFDSVKEAIKSVSNCDVFFYQTSAICPWVILSSKINY